MNVFVLTGAGVSAESGLGTFRDQGGIWTRYDLNEVATPEGFAADPLKVHAFYNARRENLAGAAPNSAHRALGRLEAAVEAGGGEFTLCTQNVDDLHEQAGSRRVIHMHGELGKTRCADCGEVRPDSGPLSLERACARCGAVGRERPDVVWFGEIPLHMDALAAAIGRADLFAAIGTSGSVYPAAGFVTEARAAGVRTCELNLEPSENARIFDERRYGPAGEVVPAWVEEMAARLGGGPDGHGAEGPGRDPGRTHPPGRSGRREGHARRRRRRHRSGPRGPGGARHGRRRRGRRRAVG